MKILKTFLNTAFQTIESGRIDSDDTCRIRFSEPQHGTVIYVTGLVEGDDDALVSLGAAAGSDEYHIVYHDGFKEFEKGWYALIGREDLLNDLLMLEK